MITTVYLDKMQYTSMANGKDMYQQKLVEQKTMNEINNNLNSGYFYFLLFVTVKLVCLLKLHDLHELNDINSFIPGRKKGDLKINFSSSTVPR